MPKLLGADAMTYFWWEDEDEGSKNTSFYRKGDGWGCGRQNTHFEGNGMGSPSGVGWGYGDGFATDAGDGGMAWGS